MKKTVEVQIIKVIEIDIPDEMLTEKSMKAFSECIWTVNHQDELFEHAAFAVAHYRVDFVEGIGKIQFQELDVETEAHVLDT